jgi:alpha-amylase
MSGKSPSICLYFQVHQPYRLIEYDFFRIGEHAHYENRPLNEGVLHKVCDRCYLPVCRLFQRLIDESDGQFCFALSLSGVLMEQLAELRPDVLESFRRLVATGRVEILGETYYHSLASLFSEAEFREQVRLHGAMVETHFGVKPTVFRNTELVYSNQVAVLAEELGFRGVLAEGVTWLLSPRSPNHIFSPPTGGPPRLLLRNAGLSDDFAFRFSDATWKEYPVTPSKALAWVRESGGEVANLFMDLESLGEHQELETGIFQFWEGFVRAGVAAGIEFLCPGEAVDSLVAERIYDCPRVSSWADHERDASAWLGGPMQEEAASKIFSMEAAIRATGNQELLESWRRLQTSDHLHYMSTKGGTDGMVHDHFRPYESPYDAYIYFMNALADLQIRVDECRVREKVGALV